MSFQKSISKQQKKRMRVIPNNDVESESSEAEMESVPTICFDDIAKRMAQMVSPHIWVNGKTNALHLACEQDRLEVVKSLIKKEINLDLFDSDGNTALILACRNNHYAIVDVLLQYALNPNFKDANGENALMIACRSGNIAIIHSLLDYDADVNALNPENHDALYLLLLDQ